MNLDLIFSKVGLSRELTQDLTLLVVVLVISLVFGLLVGRYRLLSMLINIYVAFAVVSVVPKGLLKDYTYELLIFLILVVVLTLVSKQLFEIYLSGAGSGFLVRVLAMSFLEVVLLLSIILSIVPEKVVSDYVSANAYEYLVSDWARLAWMVAPLLFMIAIHRRINR